MQNTTEDPHSLTSSIRLPLAIKPTPGGLKLVDRSGQVLAWFYTDEDPRRQSSGGMLDPVVAEWVAKTCARAITASIGQEDGCRDREGMKDAG